jgi:carbon-monoxide dehydrogenase medium subunit
MYDFQFVKPATLADAVKALGDAEARPISGGQTLIPTLKQRLAQPTALVDLTGVAEMVGIEAAGGAVTIKGATTHAAVAASETVQHAIPALAHLAAHIGDPQVRNRGTIGGSVANNDPAACYPSAVLALGATVVTNTREIAADDFFQGMFTTALEESEIVTAVRFPIPEKANYQKFVQPASRFALVGVFVAKFAGAVRVAVTGAGPCAFRATALEQALADSFTPEAARAVSWPEDGLNEDLHASPAYRAALIPVLAARAVAACGEAVSSS